MFKASCKVVHDERADNGPNYKSDVELWNEVKVNKDFNDKGNHYITSVCKNYLLYGGFPSNSHKNKLDLTFINLVTPYFKRSILNKIKVLIGSRQTGSVRLAPYFGLRLADWQGRLAPNLMLGPI